MFTGLIQKTGKVGIINQRDGGVLLSLDRPVDFTLLEPGESIAVDGVCLTLTSYTENEMTFFLGKETLDKTHFSHVKPEQELNLERSLRMGDRLGGHMVTGHADGICVVTDAKSEGECLWLEFKVSHTQFRFIIPKGSVCINGVSLTVNNIKRGEANDYRFDVLLIPETLMRTNLSKLQVGSFANIECDQTVKIIAHQLEHSRALTGESHEQHL